MDTKVQIQPTDLTTDAPEVNAKHAAQSAPKPAWHAPVVTRIDIKRTMDYKGSGNDNIGRSGIA
ncbi:hypothetical protein D4R89_13910 [bacterium]|nr:MAG: hypothetical protein D4R89_13910 [bacterium]